MRKVCAALLLCSAAFAQTARYPAAIATDQDLTLQKDRAQSTLTAPMTSSATTFTVVSGSKFAAGMIVTIENEQALVCQVSGNTISVGYSACPNIDGRGYAGTSAASHYTWLPVSGNVVAFQHNALKTEIQAVETALGPRLLNVYASVPLIASSLYVFPPQTCNASQVCSAGGASGATMNAVDTQVTMTPVPPGVNGTDLYHRLYVSGGTGVAEACLIDGGTGTAGQASGTIILECDHSHTGAFTISTASGGIEEASSALGNIGTVSAPKGTLNIYATMVLPNTITVVGQGGGVAGGTTLACAAAASPCVVFAADPSTTGWNGMGGMRNLRMSGPGSGYGLWIGGDGADVFAPTTWQGNYLRFDSITVAGFSTELTHRRGNFTTYVNSTFGSASATRALYIPSDANGEFQPIEFYGCLLNVPGEFAVQMDNNGDGTVSVHFVGGQVSGGITGAKVGWESTGTHYEMNQVNTATVNITTNFTHEVKITGGIISTHGGGTLASAIIMAGGGSIWLTLKDVWVIVDSGMTVTNLVMYGPATSGALHLDGIGIALAGVVTNPYAIYNDATMNATAISINLPATAYLAQGTAQAAATLVFPRANYPIAQPIVIGGVVVGTSGAGWTDGITAVSGLLRGQSGVFTTIDIQRFVAGATIGNTAMIVPFVPYTYYFDGTKIWITPSNASYTLIGGFQPASHTVRGSCTIGTSCYLQFFWSSVFASTSTYDCTCTDQTAAAACRVNKISGIAAELTGTGTDVLGYICVGY